MMHNLTDYPSETCLRCRGWVWHRKEPCNCKVRPVVLPKDFLAALGERLRVTRCSKGLSQDQLAEAAGMSKTGLWQIEKGHSEPGAKTIVALAKALDVTTDYLLLQSPE